MSHTLKTVESDALLVSGFSFVASSPHSTSERVLGGGGTVVVLFSLRVALANPDYISSEKFSTSLKNMDI
jgi:hypothetical protein